MKCVRFGLFLFSLVLFVSVGGCDQSEGDPNEPAGGGPGRPTPSEPEGADSAEEPETPGEPEADPVERRILSRKTWRPGLPRQLKGRIFRRRR